MLGSLSQRLLPALQLTRMALVFTAIADSTCTLLLAAEFARRAETPALTIWSQLPVRLLLAGALTSVGLYAFGMSLNDIIDRRRDRQVAAHRPLPSGRIGVAAAHLICALMLLLALGAATYYSLHAPAGFRTLLLAVWTAALIAFYDLAGKYLVWPGLLSLGLIRFFHAVVPAPDLPLLWHPLLLLNHVAVLSALAYHWEEKRPPLTRLQGVSFTVGLVLVNAVAVGFIAWSRHERGLSVIGGSLRLAGGQLLIPLATVLFFVALALAIGRHKPIRRREAGQRLMLAGLLWLIVYDAAFVASYVDFLLGGLLLLLLPVAWWSVQFMRWWSKVLSLSQRPKFQRVET